MSLGRIEFTGLSIRLDMPDTASSLQRNCRVTVGEDNG